jgi:hypothetical protein
MALSAPDDANVVATDRMQRPAYGMCRQQFPGEYGAEFHLSAGDWIRLARRCGFEVDDLIDIYAPTTGRQTQHSFVTRQWARQWPSEEVWKLRSRARGSLLASAGRQRSLKGPVHQTRNCSTLPVLLRDPTGSFVAAHRVDRMSRRLQVLPARKAHPSATRFARAALASCCV